MSDVLEPAPDSAPPAGDPTGVPTAPVSADAAAGLAHVATASFLASRVAPTGGFAVALAGGVALARVGQRAGTRTGYGASLAALLQTIAIMGPSRIGIPLTQGLSAPLLGRQHERGTPVPLQLAFCAMVRLLSSVLSAAFYIWIIVGGVGSFAQTYSALLGRIPGAPHGSRGALAVTLGGVLLWTVCASVVQVLVYRRALQTWPTRPGAVPAASTAHPAAEPAASARRLRFDPRAVAMAAFVAFAVLLLSTAWVVLAAVAAWLAVAWATARAEREPVRAGLALAGLLGGGALIFGVIGGTDLDLTLQRTVRAALLVLVATWLRAAAGEDGLREVARRGLHRLRWVPAVPEASAILDRLGERGGIAASGRALVDEVRDVPMEAAPLAAALLRWVTVQADSFTPPAIAANVPLRARGRDGLLVAIAIAAASALVVPVT